MRSIRRRRTLETHIASSKALSQTNNIRRSFRPCLEALEDRCLLSTLVVSTTGNAGSGSLRKAIMDANSQAGADLITFKLPAGLQTIHLLSALPVITESVTIDGTTKIDFMGQPLIELDGSMAGPTSNGLEIVAPLCVVRSLVINRFGGEGIFIHEPAAVGNTVEGCYIGTNATGTGGQPNRDGVRIGGGASKNIIGSLDAAKRNLISGNMIDGVDIDSRATKNTVEGNYIGTNVLGKFLPFAGNGVAGVHIQDDSDQNVIGGTVAGARNVISFNLSTQVRLSGHANHNLVEGNYIGLAANGIDFIGGGEGVLLEDSASSNTIGGTTSGTRNVISGNFCGVHIDGANAPNSPPSQNVVEGNFIGPDFTGVSFLPKQFIGVCIEGFAQNNTIGGTSAGARNVISGNRDLQMFIRGSAVGNVVQGNFIGTDRTGTAASMLGSGIDVSENAVGTRIGGTTPGAGNLISGTDGTGIEIFDAIATLVQGNLIGTDRTGSLPLGNGLYGIILEGTQNLVGGTTTAARNIISGNLNSGVVLDDSFGTPLNDRLMGNYIGTDITGALAVGNGGDGCSISGTSNFTVGGAGSGEGNLISGNAGDGVHISDDQFSNPSDHNLVLGNSIGLNALGLPTLGNQGHGVAILGKATGNQIGGTLIGRNRIGGNVHAGVAVTSATAFNNPIRGNAMSQNGGLGIDLGDNGVTLNHLGGPIPGPNHLENFPVLSSATSSGGGTTIVGDLDSGANTTYTVDLYATFLADPSGYGEGLIFLTSADVTTDMNGHAHFSITVAPAVPASSVVTAAATDQPGNTSEFSADLGVQVSPSLTTTADGSIFSKSPTALGATVAAGLGDQQRSAAQIAEVPHLTATAPRTDAERTSRMESIQLPDGGTSTPLSSHAEDDASANEFAFISAGMDGLLPDGYRFDAVI